MLFMFRCKIDKRSDISSSKKFWNSSGKRYGVLRLWILVLKKCRLGSQELSSNDHTLVFQNLELHAH